MFPPKERGYMARKKKIETRHEADEGAENTTEAASVAEVVAAVKPIKLSAEQQIQKALLQRKRFLAVRMSSSLAKKIVGHFQVEIPIPKDETIRDVEVGARLFLREWNGAPTGRADLCCVIGVTPEKDTCIVERRWCWKQGKTDDDLSQLSLEIIPDHFPMIGFEVP